MTRASPHHNASSEARKVSAEQHERPTHSLGGYPHPGGTRTLATIMYVAADTLYVTFGTGPSVQVIKPTKVCPAIDQDVDGYTYDYSVDATEKQKRTSTKGSAVETQVVVPKFIVGDAVEVAPAPGNLAAYAPGLTGVKYQVVNSPAYWDMESA